MHPVAVASMTKGTAKYFMLMLCELWIDSCLR